MKDLKDWNSTTGKDHRRVLFYAADIRGFNRFIDLRSGMEIVFAVYDLNEDHLADRFLFNVGQAGKPQSSYNLHTDIKGAGSVVSIFESSHSQGSWDMLLKYSATCFRLTADHSSGYFNLKIKVTGKQDPCLLPFVFAGPLWDNKSKLLPESCKNGTICLGSRENPLFIKGGAGFSPDRSILFECRSDSQELRAFIRSVVQEKNQAALKSVSRFFRTVSSMKDFKELSEKEDCGFIEKNSLFMPFSDAIDLGFSHTDMFPDFREEKSLYEQALGREALSDEHFPEYADDHLNEISAVIPDDESDAATIYRVLEILVDSNTVLDPSDNTFYTLLNRSWVDMLENIFKLEDKWVQGPFISNWAGSFSALLSSLFSSNLARNNIIKIVNTREPNGKIPEFQLTDKVSDRSCLPVLAFCVWKIYQRNGDSTLISAVFEHLLEWINWFEENRKDSYGLYTWGSDNPENTDQFGNSAGFTDATWESGMEDSPMWSELTWNSETSLVSASCAGLSSMIALNYRILSKMADVLGLSQQKEMLSKKSDELCSRIDELLYDSRTNTYKNRRHDGAFVRTVTPTSFFPLLAGIPDSRRGENIIKYGLFNNDLCWGDFPLSSVAKSYWGYDPDGPGWRGRVWPPLNYLVYQGLKRYSPCHAARLASASAALFLREYRSHGHVHENYSARTGWGEAREGDCTRSCPWFTWGGLLGLMLLEEIIDIDMDGLMRFGSPFFDRPVNLDNMLIKGERWSVTTSLEATTAHVEDMPFFHSCPGTGIRNMKKSDSRLNFDIIGNGETTIRIHPQALGVSNAIARVYDSDIFLGKFALESDSCIIFDLALEPMVPKSIKIKLIS